MVKTIRPLLLPPFFEGPVFEIVDETMEKHVPESFATMHRYAVLASLYEAESLVAFNLIIEKKSRRLP